MNRTCRTSDTRQLHYAAQVFRLMREKQLPMVIDADGLYIVTKNLDLVKGYPHAILTPNKNEYQRLASALNVDIEQVLPTASFCILQLALHGQNCLRYPAVYLLPQS